MAEGHRELTQHGVLTSIVAFGMCDLYADGQSLPPDQEGAAQLRASSNSGRPGPFSSRSMPSPWPWQMVSSYCIRFRFKNGFKLHQDTEDNLCCTITSQNVNFSNPLSIALCTVSQNKQAVLFTEMTDRVSL